MCLIGSPFLWKRHWVGFNCLSNDGQLVFLSNISRKADISTLRAGFIPEIKKSALVNDWEIMAYWEESEQTKCWRASVVRFKNGGSGVAAPGKRCKFFFPHLSLETIFSATELTRNCYINMNIFSSKTGNFIIKCLPLYYAHTMLERLVHNLTKNESKEIFVNQPVCMKNNFIRHCCFNNVPWHVREVVGSPKF